MDLRTTGFITGAVLLVVHVLALISGPTVVRALKDFPRSRPAGIGLLTVAALWAFLLIRFMDLGEFSHLRPILSVVIPAAYVLTLFFVDEFLAVRALGMVILLVACVLLDSAFLKPEVSRLVLVTLAYVWIVAALFWIGKPYLLRDQIEWVTAKTGRFQLATVLGAAYGAALLFLAATRY
ncbi:MAG TPA: hypothetical protein VIT91_08530 [Chthoniobacterales bacterium]